MDLTGIGENDVAVYQLRKDELMYGSSGGMDPAQLGCDFELLGTKRPGNYDFSITKMIFKFLVVAEVHNFQLSEVPAQTIGKPWWSVPEVKTVMKDDEKLHAKLSRVSVISFGSANRVPSCLSVEGYQGYPIRSAKCHAMIHLASGRIACFLRRRR